MTLEKLAEQIFKECEQDGEPITKEESLEMARMELGAKEIKHNAQADKPRKKSTKERKVDTEKLKILTFCLSVCVLFSITDLGCRKVEIFFYSFLICIIIEIR